MEADVAKDNLQTEEMRRKLVADLTILVMMNLYDTDIPSDLACAIIVPLEFWEVWVVVLRH